MASRFSSKTMWTMAPSEDTFAESGDGAVVSPDSAAYSTNDRP